MTIEENVITGGFGEQVLDYVSRAGLDVMCAISAYPMIMWSTEMWRFCRKEVGLDKDMIVKQAGGG